MERRSSQVLELCENGEHTWDAAGSIHKLHKEECRACCPPCRTWLPAPSLPPPHPHEVHPSPCGWCHPTPPHLLLHATNKHNTQSTLHPTSKSQFNANHPTLRTLKTLKP